MRSEPQPVNQSKTAAADSSGFRGLLKLEYLPFAILVILSAISLVSRIILLLK
jgi:hypothetical protein